jgi:DNA polymerase III delta prime subunit
MNLQLSLSKANIIPNSLLLVGPDAQEKLEAILKYIKEIYNDEEIAGKIDRGSFLDLKILGATGDTIKIEEIREVISFLYLSPLESDKKFVIICNADKMNHNAANSLLKVLEEPPSNSYIILIAFAAESLLATIRSRCMVVNFLPKRTFVTGSDLTIAEEAKVNEIMARIKVPLELANQVLNSYYSFLKMLNTRNESDIIVYINQVSGKNLNHEWKIFQANFLYFLRTILGNDSVYYNEDEKKFILNSEHDKNILHELYQVASKMFLDDEKLNSDKKSVALILIQRLLKILPQGAK